MVPDSCTRDCHIVLAGVAGAQERQEIQLSSIADESWNFPWKPLD